MSTTLRLMTCEYAAKELGMSVDFLSQLAQDGKIPSTKFNGGGKPKHGHHKGKRFFLASDVEIYKSTHGPSRSPKAQNGAG